MPFLNRYKACKIIIIILILYAAKMEIPIPSCESFLIYSKGNITKGKDFKIDEFRCLLPGIVRQKVKPLSLTPAAHTHTALVLASLLQLPSNACAKQWMMMQVNGHLIARSWRQAEAPWLLASALH